MHVKYKQLRLRTWSLKYETCESRWLVWYYIFRTFFCSLSFQFQFQNLRQNYNDMGWNCEPLCQFSTIWRPILWIVVEDKSTSSDLHIKFKESLCTERLLILYFFLTWAWLSFNFYNNLRKLFWAFSLYFENNS